MVTVLALSGVGRADVAVAGGKGANLGELVRAGLPVPPGFVIPTAAYDAFVEQAGIGPEIVSLARSGWPESTELIGALFAAHVPAGDWARAITRSYLALGGPVAVRSSATAEDLAGASFAGQQDTYLHVIGADAVLAAVRDCWASLWTDRAIAYRAREGIDPEDVSLAVVVQAMVAARSSGVLFTADPASGRRDRAAVSAAWGLGESVVGGTVSTDDLVVDPATGAVVGRTVADKAVMTVATPTGTREEPVPDERRRAAVLDDAAAAELVALGVRIAELFGSPQDVEWARDAGGAFHVVQARPITALPEPTGDAPTSWPVPFPGGTYFRASIVEQLPDPLTPLFADLVDGSVSRSLGALMATAFGSPLRDGDLAFPTVNGYAYYFYRNAGLARMLLRTPQAVRALLGHDAGELRGGVDGWRERSHPAYVAEVREWADRDPAALTGTEILDGVGALLDAGTRYYTAVQSIIPLAAGSEIVFAAFHDRLVRRAGDPAAQTFLVGFDSRPLQAEKSLYDLAHAPRDAAWDERFRRHLAEFGHTVYNLDFASPVPADDPGPLHATIRFFAEGGGADPHERQRRTAALRDELTRVTRARLDPLRRTLFDRLLAAAQSTGPVREDALADVGLAWPAMRRMLRELGRRLVEDGVVAHADDVFWLRRAELRGYVDGVRPDRRADVDARRMLWRGQRRATPPQLLPERPWMSRLLGSVMPGHEGAQSGPVVRGTGASAGQVTARARVLDGPADFAALVPGEVLVARITTPAWTPLFAMAAAVVTDIGGPLSHGSIVAREYGIPAVLGTGSATGRIRTGQEVRVDGDAGTVTLLDEPAAEEPSVSRRWPGWVAAGVAAGLLARRLRR
ncbi:PEP/pyruvate-binding domain-containing protein [Pseudonocardia abyssalis]|uniref:Phosphoenolpyruvate synthase n=1 Tax=Pseudonocardia abyssalis TaxID=2792008 RepID=A0ABS6V0Q5_9PSEU|nr:PEP/pyruvate-binding domain-containing protein [Pseudonocardia abyssalis]MBW0114017.1 phosphoenolpyruvate synthase [Pseudonocardia abyssalis]MBW0138085.1 phosphoenolpyruvate synthase [Pseudonocardia abyssalis]